MLNNMIVASVTGFSGTTTPDKNGNSPVMLQCIAGQMPNRNVLAGTVAQRAGIEVGKTYLVNVRETGYDDVFGPDYTFIKIMELKSGLDIVQAARELGEPRILYVQRPEGFEQHYERRGDAVESNRTKRMKAGVYHPTVQTTVRDHTTARDVKDGTSVGSGGTIKDEIRWLKERGAEITNEETLEDEEGPLFPEPNENDESNDSNEGDDTSNAFGSQEEFEAHRKSQEIQNTGNNKRNPVRDAGQEQNQAPAKRNQRGNQRGNG